MTEAQRNGHLQRKGYLEGLMARGNVLTSAEQQDLEELRCWWDAYQVAKAADVPAQCPTCVQARPEKAQPQLAACLIGLVIGLFAWLLVLAALWR